MTEPEKRVDENDGLSVREKEIAASVAKDSAFLKALRELAPKRGSGINAIEIRTPDGRVTRLTPETRDRISARLKRLKKPQDCDNHNHHHH